MEFRPTVIHSDVSEHLLHVPMRVVNKTEVLPSHSLREPQSAYTKRQMYQSECDKSKGGILQRVRRTESSRLGGRVGCNFKLAGQGSFTGEATSQ